jgi:hypothetical protein
MARIHPPLTQLRNVRNEIKRVGTNAINCSVEPGDFEIRKKAVEVKECGGIIKANDNVL